MLAVYAKDDENVGKMWICFIGFPERALVNNKSDVGMGIMGGVLCVHVCVGRCHINVGSCEWFVLEDGLGNLCCMIMHRVLIFYIWLLGVLPHGGKQWIGRTST